MTNSEMPAEKAVSPSSPEKNEVPVKPSGETDPAVPIPPVPEGIQFLIMVFMFWNPVYDIFFFFERLHFLENSLFVSFSTSAFDFYRHAGWCVIAVSTLISVYTGYRLRRKKEWRSIRLARWALWIVGPLTVILMRTLDFILHVGGPGYFLQGFDFFMYGLFRQAWGYYLAGTLVFPLSLSLPWAIGWSIYLGKSLRVRELYRNGLATSSEKKSSPAP